MFFDAKRGVFCCVWVGFGLFYDHCCVCGDPWPIQLNTHPTLLVHYFRVCELWYLYSLDPQQAHPVDVLCAIVSETGPLFDYQWSITQIKKISAPKIVKTSQEQVG